MTKVWPPAGYPVLEGFQELTEEWGLTLPEPMARRVEDENLVLWRPGFTALIAAFGEGSEEQSRTRRLKLLRRELDPDGRVVLNADDGEVIRFALRLRDVTPDGMVESVAGYAITNAGHLSVTIYMDDAKKDEKQAIGMIESIRYAGI